MDQDQLSAGWCGPGSTYTDHQGQHQRLADVCTDKRLLQMAPDVRPSCNGKDGGQLCDPGHKPCGRTKSGLRPSLWRHRGTGSLFGRLSPRCMLVVFCAELVGTALVLFVGCMSTVTGLPGASQASSSLQSGLVFGMVIASVIHVIGHISRAHLNPAVTFCAVLRGDLTIPAAVAYVTAEVVGATAGYGLLRLVTPSSAECSCTTTPSAGLSTLQALLVEALATALLVLLCHASWDPVNSRNSDSTPLKFGCYITVISAAAGPYSGASMNPARSVAPAIWTGVWTDHWVYWVGPLLGSALASLLYLAVFGDWTLSSDGEECRGGAAGDLATLPGCRNSKLSGKNHVEPGATLTCAACYILPGSGT